MEIESFEDFQTMFGNGTAFPGCYELHAVMQDGGILCRDCVVSESDLIQDGFEGDPQWRPVGVETHWEGDPMACDHCGRDIISEYSGGE